MVWLVDFGEILNLGQFVSYSTTDEPVVIASSAVAMRITVKMCLVSPASACQIAVLSEIPSIARFVSTKVVSDSHTIMENLLFNLENTLYEETVENSWIEYKINVSDENEPYIGARLCAFGNDFLNQNGG